MSIPECYVELVENGSRDVSQGIFGLKSKGASHKHKKFLEVVYFEGVGTRGSTHVEKDDGPRGKN